MKYIKCLILSLFVLLLGIPVTVDAADEDNNLKPGDFEMECVYDNGLSISIYYADGSYMMSTNDFKIVNAVKLPYNTSMTYFYKEDEMAKTILQNAKCPSEIYAGLVQQSDGKNTVNFQVIVDNNNSAFWGGTLDDVKAYLKQSIIPGFTPTSGQIVKHLVTNGTPLGNRGQAFESSDWVYATNQKRASSFRFYLINEQMYFNDSAKPINQWAFKNEGQQATSKATYITVSEYKTELNTPLKTITKGQTTTKIIEKDDNFSLSTSDDYMNFVCVNLAIKSIQTNKNEMGYVFSGVRHQAYKLEGIKKDEYVETMLAEKQCNENFTLYRQVSMAEAAENEQVGTSICDVIPETSLLIATVIYYAGILVPILLIVYTALDIAKLVISGNIEEEIPKKKKAIITRFIVAVVFFFLPIIINIFVSSEYGTDFGDVSCLWSTDISEESPESEG